MDLHDKEFKVVEPRAYSVMPMADVTPEMEAHNRAMEERFASPPVCTLRLTTPMEYGTSKPRIAFEYSLPVQRHYFSPARARELAQHLLHLATEAER